MDNEVDSDSIITGNYRILETIGTGGWATVYKAQHLHLDRVAAVKIMHRHIALDEAKQQRFKQEAENISKISAPNVVTLLDYGFTKDTRAFLVLEYVNGISLSSHLKKHKPSIQQTLSICKQICRGLQAAHASGIVHRDLKPENVLLAETGTPGEFQVKITDFGIAKTLDSGSVTKTGETIGTPSYMSPEQCTGKPVDGRSDLYNLGCIMYEMLTGSMLVQAENSYECMYMHVEGKVPPFAPELQIDPALEKVVRKLLSKQPEKRYATALEAWIALESVSYSGDGLTMPVPLAIAQRVVFGVLAVVFITWFTYQVINYETTHGITSGAQHPRDAATQIPPGAAATLYLNASTASDEDIRRQIILSKDLKKLFLEETHVSDHTMKALETACPHLEELYLRRTGITDAGLKYISKLPSLRQLYLTYTKVDDAGMEEIGKLDSMQALSLSRTGVGDPGISKLRNLKDLRWLHVVGNNVSDASADVLAGFPKLENLNISRTRMSGRSFDKLPPSLVRLIAFFIKLDDAGVQALEKLPKLKTLDLTGNPITDGCVDSLAKLAKLESLRIGRTKIGAAGLARIGGFTQLENLAANDLTITDQSVSALSRLNNLRSLDLSGCPIGDKGIAALQSLPLSDLNLDRTRVGDLSLAMLSEMPNLTHLNVSKTQVTARGLLQLQKLPKLQTLVADGIPMSPEEKALLVRALPNCTIKN
jgi:tRNA A-37 threonylcarbamoyl transferase component Bud32/Leucine-rich repeat (LRR) protein